MTPARYWLACTVLAVYMFSIVLGCMYTAMHSATDCAAGVMMGAAVWAAYEGVKSTLESFTAAPANPCKQPHSGSNNNNGPQGVSAPVYKLPTGQNVTTKIAYNKAAMSFHDTSAPDLVKSIINPNDLDNVCPCQPISKFHTKGLDNVKGCVFALA
ncbi:hypothetical protein CONPUDRAFT_157508 [Coniophora puteana RWD-64-598 SS2]|uniref:Phosphatidic acid phosphatase type 2/haloperoxidase domain-containing protein n=1 Tax=Coniophora puteana (strain RWD-64-598) TaxID=741705 RepID=A0A5M3MEM0_CONPW|nr:uncharacterized protein CONPUDRAFT_157508 [Coniophora puteana RWD-64-598 SS2]EIW77244.1 hypothetical protein CONPUDRAFT_157508 [Coniophora puteana RWD-64-598 SS2]